MDILDLLEAILKLGLPLLLLSWLIFTKLYESGVISRGESGKHAEQQLKAFNKTARKKTKGVKRTPMDHVMRQWSSFGGGFYGLAALWTFLVIELKDAIGFIFYFPGLNVLFENGLISFLVSILINQITNAISALVWFNYWPAESIFVWVIAAYLGYWLGMELAKRGYLLPIEKSIDLIRLWIGLDSGSKNP